MLRPCLQVNPPAYQGLEDKNWFHEFLGMTPTQRKGGNSPRDKSSGICKHDSAFIQDSPPEVWGTSKIWGHRDMKDQTPANYLRVNKAGLQAATKEQKLFWK